MTEPAPKDRSLGEAVGRRETRRLRARRAPGRSVLEGFGFFGLIGWSVAIPTLLGAAAGRWLDRAHPGGRNWTVALILAGLVLGCLNAWHWVAREQRAIDREHENEHEEDSRDDD